MVLVNLDGNLVIVTAKESGVIHSKTVTIHPILLRPRF